MVFISNSTILPFIIIIIIIEFGILELILFLVLLRLLLNKLGGFFKVSRNPIHWLASALVETETGQSTAGSNMPFHLS